MTDLSDFQREKMYLHVGNEKMVLTKNIVGIFDMDTATVSNITKDFLKKKENEKSTHIVSLNLPKSFTLEKSGKVWFSGISTGALCGRLKG